MPNRQLWITQELQEQIYPLRRSNHHSVRIDMNTVAEYEGSPGDPLELLSELVNFFVSHRRFSQFAGRLHYVVGDDFIAVQRNTFNEMRWSFEDRRNQSLSITINRSGLSQLELPSGVNMVRAPSLTGDVDDRDPNHPIINISSGAEIENRPTYVVPCFEAWTQSQYRRPTGADPGRGRMGASRFQSQLLNHPDRSWTTELFSTEQHRPSLDEDRPFSVNYQRGPSIWQTEWASVSGARGMTFTSHPEQGWRMVTDTIALLLERLQSDLHMSRRGRDPNLLWRKIIDGLHWRISPEGLLATYAPASDFESNSIEPLELSFQTDIEQDPPPPYQRAWFLRVNIEVSPFLRLPPGTQTPSIYVLDNPFNLSEDFPAPTRSLWTFPSTRIVDHRPTDITTLLDAGLQTYSNRLGNPVERRQPRRIQQRTFGVELEVVGLSTRSAAHALRARGIQAEAESYNHQTRPHWKCVPDASLLPSRGTPEPVDNGDPDDDEIAIGTQRELNGEFQSNGSPMWDCGGCVDPECGECGGAAYNEDCGACRDGECDGHPPSMNGDERQTFPHAEIVSPVLSYSDPHQWRELQLVIDSLQEGGAQVTRRCGFHVHVGANDLSRHQLAALVDTYQTMGWLFDQLCDRSRRGVTNYNCRHLSSRQLNSLTQSIRQGQFPDQYRYSSINVSCFPRQGTVEFRQHQGTLDSVKIANWVRLCVGMVQAAVEDQLPNMRSNMDETTMLDALSTMVDGPTALWFLQRRNELNAESNLSRLTPPTLPVNEPEVEPEYPNEEGTYASEDGDSEFHGVNFEEEQQDQSPSNPRVMWHDPVRGEDLRIRVDGDEIRYRTAEPQGNRPRYMHETADLSTTVETTNRFTWNLAVDWTAEPDPPDEPQE